MGPIWSVPPGPEAGLLPPSASSSLVAARLIFEGWAKELTQEQLDQWVRGEISVSARVRALFEQHPMMVRSSRGLLRHWLEGLDGSGIFEWLKEKRPDLVWTDPSAARARMDADLAEVRELVERF